MRLPTIEEIQKLAKCKNRWTGNSKKFKQGKNTLYLPAAGFYYNNVLYYEGSFGYYWLSTEFSDTTAYGLYFHPSYINPQYINSKTYHFSILAIVKDINVTTLSKILSTLLKANSKNYKIHTKMKIKPLSDRVLVEPKAAENAAPCPGGRHDVRMKW